MNFLNTLTCYTYVMPGQEQLLKFELRMRLMTEALQKLQKDIKLAKGQSKTSPLKLKAQIASSLFVIHSLINFKGVQNKHAMPKENFMHSIKMALAGPTNIVKTLNELIGDIMDLSNSTNAKLIRYSVAILNTLADHYQHLKGKGRPD